MKNISIIMYFIHFYIIIHFWQGNQINKYILKKLKYSTIFVRSKKKKK